MATQTFYPDADPESTSVDGMAGEMTSQTWSNIRSDVGDTSDDNAIGYLVFTRTTAVSGQFDIITRMIIVFDTSTMPDGVEINSATLEIWNDGKQNSLSLSDADAGIGLASSNPSSNTSVSNSDYGNVGSTELANRILYSELTAGTHPGYRTFTLNSAGLSNLNTDDVSSFSIRLGADLDNNEPTWSSENAAGPSLNTSEDGNPPKLTINYTSYRTPKSKRVTGETKRIYG